MNDRFLDVVNRRLLSLEAQLEQLRTEITAVDSARGEKAAGRQPAPEHRASAVPASHSEAHMPHADRSETSEAPANRTFSPPREHDSGTAFERLLSGRGLAVAGLVLILIGCAYFLDLSFTRGWITPAERIALGIAVGSALIAGSVRLFSGAYRRVAEGTVGIGAGIVFLSTWAAIAVFPELNVSRVAAFAAMMLVTLILSLIAQAKHSQPVALMGLGGAYLTPLLLPEGLSNHVALAGYLFTVTGGLLVLARRNAFTALECMAALAAIFYSPAFAPYPGAGWPAAAAAAVASVFYALFAIAFTRGAAQSGRPSRYCTVAFVSLSALYIAALERIFAADPHPLGGALLGLAALLIGLTALRIVPRELVGAYRCVGGVAANLALLALLGRTELLDVFAIEGAALAIFGKAAGARVATAAGIGLASLAALGLIGQALFNPPALALFTPLALGFATWSGAAYAMRNTLPPDVREAGAIAAHAVVLVGLIRIALDATGGAYWQLQLPSLTQFTFSVSWAIFAALLFGSGIVQRNRIRRWEGLTIFAITLVKVFSIDLAGLDITYRIIAFIGIGIVLFVSSAAYLRFIAAPDDARQRIDERAA